jgi:hypothetical protein
MNSHRSATILDESQTAPKGHKTQDARKYVFAVVYAAEVPPIACAGMDGNEVSAIIEGRLAAVVSGVEGARIRPERRRLAVHQEVLKHLLAVTTPLPMKFGILVDSPDAVRRILRRNQRRFVEQLDRVAGKLEFGLRVTWDVPNIFEYFVGLKSELRLARDRLLGCNRPPAQDDKIELGRLFDRLLAEERERRTERVEQVLAQSGIEVRANPCRNEHEVMHLACLVSRAAKETFGDVVFRAAETFDNRFAFDYNGPWAPHNFVETGMEL